MRVVPCTCFVATVGLAVVMVGLAVVGGGVIGLAVVTEAVLNRNAVAFLVFFVVVHGVL